jgi:dihydroorotate dehydrogenase (fumarate)
MRSIFEEQIAAEQLAAHRHFDSRDSAETRGVLPDTDVFALGVHGYVEQLRRIRSRTNLKVIGSINGVTAGGWIEYAQRIEQAGAHALELNLYSVPCDARRTAQEIEGEQLMTVREVARTVRLPVAVKLSPSYSALPSFVRALEQSGARGVILFNRPYQADIDPIRLEAVRSLHLSTPEELLLRLRWLAIVSPQTRLDLAVSGGVHRAIDAVKAIMAGAHVAQTVSALMLHGASHLTTLVNELRRFLEEQEYESIDAMRGNMSRAKSPDPSAYERAGYMLVLQSWHGRLGT